MLRITVKCVYDPINEDDGVRVLVDRVWPRGGEQAGSQGGSVVARGRPQRFLTQMVQP